MRAERLPDLKMQREALLIRIAEAKAGPSAAVLVPQMRMALEALEDMIAREQERIAPRDAPARPSDYP